MVGYYGITEWDEPDIQQELRLAIFKAYPAYLKHKCAYGPYFQTVIDNARRKIIRTRKHLGIDRPSIPLDTGDGNEDDDDANADNGGMAPNHAYRPVTPDDLAKVLLHEHDDFDIKCLGDALHAIEKDALELITSGQVKSINELAQKLGVPRTSFIRNHVPHIKAILIANGFLGQD